MVSAPELIPPSPPPPRPGNPILRHWRGELPLWVSYWVVNFIVNVGSAVIAAAIFGIVRAQAGYEPMSVFATIVFIWAAVVVISVWQIVGLWRSANAHIRRSAEAGKRAPWAVAAKCAAVFMTISVAVTFVRDAAPQLNEVTRIAFMDDPDIPPYVMRVMRGGTEAEITGGFKYGLTSDFRNLLKATPTIKVVHLHSGGGRIGEAIKLYSVIKDNGLTTYVALECASACALAFAGGKQRYISTRAALGFHAPSFPGMTLKDMGKSIAEQADLFRKAGFSSVFVNRALNTPSSTLWKPTAEELMRANAISGIADNTRFAISGYGRGADKEKVGGMRVRAVPVINAIKEKHPARFASVIDGFYKSYVDGDTESEQYAKMRTNVLGFLDELRPTADDEVIVDFGRLQVDSSRYLAGRDASACYYYAGGAGGAERNFTKDLGPELIAREREINERIIRTATPRPPASDAELKASFSRMFSSPGRPKLTDEERALIKAGTLTPDKHAAACRAMIKFYDEIMSLPQTDAARVMRVVLSAK